MVDGAGAGEKWKSVAPCVAESDGVGELAKEAVARAGREAEAGVCW